MDWKNLKKPWHEFETQAAEAAAARAEEWDLPTQWGAPVRCVFLGPAAAGGAAGAAVDESIEERASVASQEQVRFRWEISVPDAPPGFAQEEVVAVRATRVFSRGIPVPAAWDPALKFRARVRQALAKAREQCADHVCTFHGIYRGPPAAAAAARPLGPRTGEKWIARQPDGARSTTEVWVAAHHAAGEWWCVKALAGVPYRILFVARSRGAALDTRFCRIVTATSARGPAVGSSSGSTPAFSH